MPLSGDIQLALISTAMAAETVTATLTSKISDVPGEIWVWALFLSVAGWFVSNAPSLVGWVDGTGLERARTRLTILSSLVGSLLAGIAAILMGLQLGASDILNLLSVIGASFAGGEWIRRVLVNKERP